jgi:hypothetical protein
MRQGKDVCHMFSFQITKQFAWKPCEEDCDWLELCHWVPSAKRDCVVSSMSTWNKIRFMLEGFFWGGGWGLSLRLDSGPHAC